MTCPNVVIFHDFYEPLNEHVYIVKYRKYPLLAKSFIHEGCVIYRKFFPPFFRQNKNQNKEGQHSTNVGIPRRILPDFNSKIFEELPK